MPLLTNLQVEFFFHLENPEISAVLQPKFALRGGGQSARGTYFGIAMSRDMYASIWKFYFMYGEIRREAP